MCIRDRFGGYFLAAYAINEMGVRMFGMPANAPLTQQFAGYALVVPFLLQIVTGLLPDFRIIAWLFQFYIAVSYTHLGFYLVLHTYCICFQFVLIFFSKYFRRAFASKFTRRIMSISTSAVP